MKLLVIDYIIIKRFAIRVNLLLLMVSYLFIGCKEKINNPENQISGYFSIVGIVSFNNSPYKNIEITLESKTCFSDSNGYFKFDSINTGNKSIRFSHPKFIQFDTLVNIKNNTRINFSLSLKDNSFFPCKIGNKWFYKSSDSVYKLLVEIIDTIKINNELYYKFLYAKYAQHFTDTLKTFYLRQVKNDTLFEYNCKKQTLAPFNFNSNIEFTYNNCSLGFTSIYSGNGFKIKEDSLKFWYKMINGFDGDFGLIFEKGVGIVSFISLLNVLVLEKYEIR